MTSILDFEPVLSHIGAIDINNAAGTMYHILYNGDITALGNILMFEYKLIDVNANIVPSNITTGFVAMENATNTGITNQWSIAIPAEDVSYNLSTPKTIQVRVYVGLTGSVKVGITKWSNELNVHNPPPKPLIAAAFFNGNSYGANFDDLFIFLTIDDAIDYDEVKFVVAYYYLDNNDNTVWDVSGLLTADAIISNAERRMITVSDFGVVHDNHQKQYVYVSVYAVYPFTIINETFYAVSEISTPYVAPAAAAYDAPILTSTTYKIYDADTSARSQVMNVGWTPPQNSDVPSFVVSKYLIEKSTDNVVWTKLSDTIDSTTHDYDVNVSQYQCGEIVYVRVTSISVMSTVSAYSSPNDYSQLEIFKYALAPSALTITSIDGADTNVTMTVNFHTPTDPGCGTPIEFNIDIDGVTVGKVTYDESSTYSKTLSNLDVTDSGTVTVYLVTSDTNPTAPGGSTYSNRNGASVSTTYVVVSDLVMDQVDYDVYDFVSQQNMNLSWSSTIPTGWSGTYTVYKTINDDDVNRQQIYTVNTVDQSNTHTDDSSGDNCNDTLGFYVILSITDGSETYDTRSDPVTKEIFKYADAPSALTITSIGGAANNVTMTVNFHTPDYDGCGAPIEFNIDIDGSNVRKVTFNESGSGSYSETLSNLDVTDSGTVTVYLVTSDTNPTEPGGSTYSKRNGASVSTTYVVVSNLEMAAVDYKVYDNPSTQEMNLSWSSTIPTGWSGTYTVYKTINDDDVNREPIYTVNTGQTPTHTHTDNTSNNNCDEILGFYVILSITDGSETYDTRSDPVTKEIFKYADAPSALTITSIGGADNNVTMTVNFNAPIYTGCGTPIEFNIDIDGSNVRKVTFNESGSGSYSETLSNLDVTDSGTVTVYLVTSDTNPTEPGGSTYSKRNGAPVSTTYVVVSNLVMDPVDYDVYEFVSQQNMNLSWSSTIPTGWSGMYTVYKTINGDDVNREPIYTVNTVDQSNTHTDDTSNNNCNEILGFYVILSISDGSETYLTRSNNTVTKEIFKYALAPQAVNVLWASSKPDETSMDLKMSFENSANTGCGQIYKYKVDVCSSNGTELATQEITHVDDTSTPMIYQVSFDNIPLQGYTAGIVNVYLKTRDTNSSAIFSGSIALGSWTASKKPIFIDVAMNDDRDYLSFSVISPTQLVQQCQIFAIVNTSVPPFILKSWNTNGTTPGTTVSMNPSIIDGTYKYDVIMEPSLIGLASFPANFCVTVSNEVGTNTINE